MGSGWALIVYLTHLAAAVGASALALWLAASQRNASRAAAVNALAVGMIALWSFSAAGFGRSSIITQIALICSNLAWLWMLYRLFGYDERDTKIGPIRPVIASLGFIELMQFGLVLAQLQFIAAPQAQALIWQISFTLHLLFAVGALVLVHNLFAGASQQSRLSLRWPAAALGLLFLFDLNFYAIAWLGEGRPQLLQDLRAFTVLVVVAILALGATRKEAELRFRPSRSFAFQSISLLVIGAYLVVMVVAAQGLAYIGSDYGRVLQTGFVLLASVAALMLLPSKRLRSWLRVSLSKNLFQHRYDYRSEWLRFTDTIGRAGPQAAPLPERAIRAVADITDSPSGLLLTTREDGGLMLAARWHWSDLEVPGEALSAEGVRFFEESQFIVDIDDLRRGTETGIPAAACPEWLLASGQSWAMVPLLHYERLVGVVVLARPPVARRLDWEDFDLLRVIGRQLASYLAEQSSQDALGEAQRFDEFNRRIAFVMHDIKNLASQLSLLAKNAEKHADKPAFRADMILTLRNSTDKLQALLARLGRYGSLGGKERQQIVLGALLERVAAQYAARHRVDVLANGECLVTADGDALEQALVHLVQNAVDATADDAPVYLDLREETNHAVIEIRDSGEGMSPEFIRTRLFKPFHSSKPGGFGIGAYEARELVRAMGGRLDVDSREGMGTRFVMRLPLSAQSEIMRSMREQADARKEVA